MANVNRCVCCGAVIPEGTWVCPNCQVCVEDEKVDFDYAAED